MNVNSRYYSGLASGKIGYNTILCISNESIEDFTKFYPGAELIPQNYAEYTKVDDHALSTISACIQRVDEGYKTNYVDKIVKDQIDMFILVSWQFRCFERRMNQHGLMKYCIHQSSLARNRNYPARRDDQGLKVYIFHYKDYVANV